MPSVQSRALLRSDLIIASLAVHAMMWAAKSSTWINCCSAALRNLSRTLMTCPRSHSSASSPITCSSSQASATSFIVWEILTFISISWTDGAPCPSCSNVTGRPKVRQSNRRSAAFSRCRLAGNSSKSSTGIPCSRHNANNCCGSSSSLHSSTLVPTIYVISSTSMG